MIGAASTALVGQAPALAQAGDADLLHAMRGFADMTSGQLVGDGQRADKILTFARDSHDKVVLTQIQAVALGGDWVEPKAGAIAILRTRASAADHDRAPERADLDYALRTGVRVFIVGEWSSPPVVWEVARQDGHVHWREIGADAKAGAWRNVPTSAAH